MIILDLQSIWPNNYISDLILLPIVIILIFVAVEKRIKSIIMPKDTYNEMDTMEIMIRVFMIRVF